MSFGYILVISRVQKGTLVTFDDIIMYFLSICNIYLDLFVIFR